MTLLVAGLGSSDVSGYPGHQDKKLFSDRWYHWYQKNAGGYVPWMTLSTSDLWPLCDGDPDLCGAKWFDPFDAAMADWNSQPTSVLFDYDIGIYDDYADVNVFIIDDFGLPGLLGLALWFDGTCDPYDPDCFPCGPAPCIQRYGWAVLADDYHTFDYGTLESKQATIAHEVGHLLSLRHESVNADESQHYECGFNGPGSTIPIPQSIMAYDCIDPVSVGGSGLFMVQPFDACGVNHAYHDPFVGYAACGIPEPYSGDVDCDSDVDAVDALRVLRHVAGLNPFLTAGCYIFADVDCDTDKDAVDALRILRYVAELDPFVPPICPVAIGPP